MNMYPTILCDLDDTLYSYNQFVMCGFRAAAGFASGYSGIEKKLFFQTCLDLWRLKGNSGQIFDGVAQALSLPPELVPNLIEAFRNQNSPLKLYQDAQAFLEAFHGKRNLGIITDGLAWVQRRKIQALAISDYFQTIIYSDDFGRNNWKPSPVPFLHALKNLGGGLPEETVYIGDNPHKDFSGAKELGIYTMRLLRGPFRKVKVAPEKDAHICFRSFKDLMEVL